MQTGNLKYLKPLAMELLDINNGSGQSYGYITYRKANLNLPSGALLQINGRICDSVLVFVNGKLISPALEKREDLNNFGYWKLVNSQIMLTNLSLTNATVDLVTENWGRVGYGKLSQYYQFKGLWQGDILINNVTVTEWEHIPLEFKKQWTLGLSGWKNGIHQGPGLFRGHVNLHNPVLDTYIDMSEWTKGIVIINGFVLGRYARIGPQQCLYLPAPLMRKGLNEIIIFDHYKGHDFIRFATDQIWKNT
ncbi:hypothetical protein ABEB36_004485 [Hypothenemus hampei]|uniref:Beta-galactosidase n=1 Tax=Hypothenemus hampei TaxID=57062 RepID=A0ABD1F3I7_HYPHA